ELPVARALCPLAGADVPSGQRDGARGHPPLCLSLLGEHVAALDEHEDDTVQELASVTPRSGCPACRRHCVIPARSARATAVPRPSRVASPITAVMMSMVTIASAQTGASAPGPERV